MKQLVLSLFVFCLLIGCKSAVEDNQQNKKKNMQQNRPIEQVMKDHSDEIMAVPGVQGFYMGELDSTKLCITVMVDKKTEENQKKIPKEIEGYPVVIEETGKIRPLTK